MKRFWLSLLFFPVFVQAALLIPMDGAQTDHLRAYGIAYRALQEGRVVHWLLYYRGGSFFVERGDSLGKLALSLGVYTEKVSDHFRDQLAEFLALGAVGDVRLEKAPKVAVYVPPHHLPWDDAVTLALEYAKIPYHKIWDNDILLKRELPYDFIHLHHEDFTGQYGRFLLGFSAAPWYQKQVRESQALAHKLGFRKVSQMKGRVARRLRQFVEGGKVLFAMCSAPDSLDVALSAEGLDIVPAAIDGDGVTPDANARLDFRNTFAFTHFQVTLDLSTREVANIDVPPVVNNTENPGVFFTLTPYSPKEDPVPAMLVQDHARKVPDFLGLTSAFDRSKIKKDVLILGSIKRTSQVKYIHGIRGRGSFTFLAGHDPEDYAHLVGEGPTDLAFHKHSPGYRLILNNVLYPASRKQRLKT